MGTQRFRFKSFQIKCSANKIEFIAVLYSFVVYPFLKLF